MHTCNYLAITAPDGLVIGLYGPFAGHINDEAAVKESRILTTLKSRYSFDGIDYCVYGDMGFKRQQQLLAEFFPSSIHDDPTKIALNKSMKPLRVSIEQVFGSIKQSFSGGFCFKTQQVGKNDFLRPFSVACLLHNFRVCIRQRSAAGETIGVTPPVLPDYLKYANRQFPF